MLKYTEYIETIAVRKLWAEGQLQVWVLCGGPPITLGPNAAHDEAFVHVRLGRENGVPPRLSLG